MHQWLKLLDIFSLITHFTPVFNIQTKTHFPNLNQPTSSSQTLASSIASPSSKRRNRGGDGDGDGDGGAQLCLHVHSLNRSALFGAPSTKLSRSRSCGFQKSRFRSIRRACSANLDAFSNEEFSKKIQELALRFQLADNFDGEDDLNVDGNDSDSEPKAANSELLKTFPGAAKYLKTLVSFGNVTPEQEETLGQYGVTLYSWSEFLQLGENKEYDLPVKKKSDICTIMYTSGTTGDPKGVLISNESIITLLAGVKRLLESVNEQLSEEDVYLSFLPLAHIFDRVIEELFIWTGAQIGFWRGDVKLLTEDIGELKPTIFCAVPRVLDRIYAGLTQKISSGGFLKKTLFNVAYSYKYHNMQNGHGHVQASPIADKVVFSKVKQGLGGRVRLILSGAAPLSTHVEAFLRVVACAHVLQGYGLTETCAGTFVSLPNELSMLGTVGPPVPNVDVCLESVPEMGYDALSDTPRGEVCVRGNTLFSGYYKREDLTKEVMIDGWFHTGDVGEWQPDGSLKIIDRKKNIFKLSQGEYVAVENLENIYGLFSDIDAIWVYGNSFESFLVAVVNPNKQAVESWAQQNGISGDFKSLCENAKVKEYILGELNKIAKEKKLKGFEVIKGVHLDPEPFDMERDLITPTYKKKRPQLLKYYKDLIDNMYKNAK